MKATSCELECVATGACFDIRSHEMPPLASDLAERYVFLISELSNEAGKVRPTELTKRMGVNAATVTRNLKRLEAQGLVTVEPHRSVQLTETGRQIADSMRFRQELIARFFLSYGVKPCTAQRDAVKLMTNISPDALRVFANLLADRLSFKEQAKCSVSSCSCQGGDCLQKRLSP